MSSWRAIKELLELAVHEFIEAKLAPHDTGMTQLFWRKWRQEGELGGILERLVGQAESAPDTARQLTYLDEQIIHRVLLPMAEGKEQDEVE